MTQFSSPIPPFPPPPRQVQTQRREPQTLATLQLALHPKCGLDFGHVLPEYGAHQVQLKEYMWLWLFLRFRLVAETKEKAAFTEHPVDPLTSSSMPLVMLRLGRLATQ